MHNRNIGKQVKEMFDKAFESFMVEDFQDAVDSSTQASWSSGYYLVELFKDGTYQVLDKKQVGNLYDSPGMMLVVPSLNDDDWDNDPDYRFYDNAEEEMRAKFAQAKAELEAYLAQR